ncbi:copper ion binding protein [Clostridium sp. KNHs214]|uniref:heavy-metal-associated domain-containing protein n=1 Tax=Clostridium sp. KNHs214 TaxID=1540257 RepID=UPI00055898DE|nr:copper ion binding protein [Clostridium sp. KNHs214]
MKKTLKVEGMSCMHCVKHVKDALEELEGVKNAEVDLQLKTVKVEMEKNIEDNILKNAVEDAGYEVIEIS